MPNLVSPYEIIINTIRSPVLKFSWYWRSSRHSAIAISRIVRCQITIDRGLWLAEE
jgi:hypothetical protein